MARPLCRFVYSVCLMLLLAACGGGGGDNGGTTPVAPPTKAIIKVSTANVPTGVLVGSVQISLILPVGVTPSILNGIDASASVASSGNALLNSAGTPVSSTLAASSYTAATRTLVPGSVSGTGFASGEFMTITCSIASGTTVTSADFPSQATVVDISDVNATPIAGASTPISVTLQ